MRDCAKGEVSSQWTEVTASRPPELRRLRVREQEPVEVRRGVPPHAPRNCGDCANSPWRGIGRHRTASRPPELRRLRARATKASTLGLGPASRPPELRRLRVRPGISGTAQTNSASRPPELRRLRGGVGGEVARDIGPPHAPRNCGDCAPKLATSSSTARGRLTPPGIAATARASKFPCPWASTRRLTPPGIAATAR